MSDWMDRASQSSWNVFDRPSIPRTAVAEDCVPCADCNGPTSTERLRKWDGAQWADVTQRRCMSVVTIKRTERQRLGLDRGERCNRIDVIETVPVPHLPPPTAPARVEPAWRKTALPRPRESSQPTVTPEPTAATVPEPHEREETTMPKATAPKGKAVLPYGGYDQNEKRRYADLVLSGKMKLADAADESGIHLPTLKAFVSVIRRRSLQASEVPVADKQPSIEHAEHTHCHRCRGYFPLQQLPTKDEAGNLHCAECTPAVFQGKPAPIVTVCGEVKDPKTAAALVNVAAAAVESIKQSSVISPAQLEHATDSLRKFESVAAAAERRATGVRDVMKRQELARLVMSDDLARFFLLDERTQATIRDLVMAPIDQW